MLNFEKNKISGSVFLKLSETQIGRMVEAMGDIELQSLQCRIIHEAGVEVCFTLCVFAACKHSCIFYYSDGVLFVSLAQSDQ